MHPLLPLAPPGDSDMHWLALTLEKCLSKFPQSHRFGFSAMSHKVVDGHLHFLAFFQSLDSFNHQLKIKSIGMVKIVLVILCLVMLFWEQYL